MVYKTQSPCSRGSGLRDYQSRLPGRGNNANGEGIFTYPPLNFKPVPVLGASRRQSHVSMSAEAGPVAHKPLFRVQVSPFLPGGKPRIGEKSFSFGDCTALNQWINPGQTPGWHPLVRSALRWERGNRKGAGAHPKEKQWHERRILDGLGIERGSCPRLRQSVCVEPRR